MKNTEKKKQKKLMFVNRLLSNPKVFFLLTLLIFLIALYFLNTLIFTFKNFPALKEPSFKDGLTFYKDMKNLYKFFVFGFILFATFKYFKIKNSYGSLNTGQKGKARASTRKEILKNNKKIPDRGVKFKGGGGFPVARDGDTLLIDDSPVNNAIIGISRSGKGEMIVFSLIDIYSRAEHQASMVITDPKLELAQSSIPTLEARGYECHILNLVDPEFSMGYNPLTLIIEEYKNGDLAAAEQLTRTLCHSIYSGSDVSGDKFWTDNASSLLTALILASIEDNIKADIEENEKIQALWQQKENIKIEEAKRKLYKENYKKWDCFRVQENYFYKIKHGGDATEDYDPHLEALEDTLNRFLKAGENKDIRREEILKFIEEERIELRYKKIKFEKTNENEKKINIYSIITTFIGLANEKIDDDTSELDRYFNDREEGNKAKIIYGSIGISGDKTKGSIFSTMLTGLNVFTQTHIAKMTAQSTFDIDKIGFGGKPVAIFIGIPDYDSSNHFIASVFIKQVYYTLVKLATANETGKCYREVVFILDEFGNLPAIEGMAGMMTVCLGRNIRFNLIIQGYSQVYKIYGEHDAKTILGNCGNHAYILTNDDDTTKEFSRKLGDKTVTDISRSGEKFSTSKNVTESETSDPLIRPEELMSLEPGEMIILRVMNRNDIHNNPIKSRPIFNLGEHRMLYRYEYLLPWFPSGVLLYDSPMIKRVNALVEEANKEVRENLEKSKEKFVNLTPKENVIKKAMKRKNYFRQNLKNKTFDVTNIEQQKQVDVENTKSIVLKEYMWSVEEYLQKRRLLKVPAVTILKLKDLNKISKLLRLTYEEDINLKNSFADEDDQILLIDLEHSAKKAIKLGYKDIGYKVLDIISKAWADETLEEEEEKEEFELVQAIYSENDKDLEKTNRGKTVFNKINPEMINKQKHTIIKRKRPPTGF